MSRTNTPQNNPNPADQKVDDLRAKLAELRQISTDQLSDSQNLQKLDSLKVEVEAPKRAVIVQASQQKLDSLKAEIESFESMPDAFKNRIEQLRPGLKTNIETLKQDVVNAITASTRTQLQQTLTQSEIQDVQEDILSVGEDKAVQDEGVGAFASGIRKLMFQFNSFKIMISKLFTFDPKKREALEKEEKTLRNEELAMLGPQGLRDAFRERARERKITIRNGQRDVFAFDRFNQLYLQRGVTLDQFIDQMLANYVQKGQGGKTDQEMETTMYGILVEKGQEENKDRYPVLNRELELEFSTNEKYVVKAENNILFVRSAGSSDVQAYRIEGSLLDKQGAAVKEMEFVFTDAELEDKGAGQLDKRLGFAMEGSAYMVVKQRLTANLSGAALKEALAKMAGGDVSGAQGLFEKRFNLAPPLNFLYPQVVTRVVKV